MSGIFQPWKSSEPQIPLDFLLDKKKYRKASVHRASIINAVGNLKTIEANSTKAFRAGQQNATQAKNITQLHRAQVQRLAALANEHAQFCYPFEHHELLFQNIGWHADPTCRRALRGCSAEITLLNIEIHYIHPASQHALVVTIIKKWYSPGFECSEFDFHNWIWTQHTASLSH